VAVKKDNKSSSMVNWSWGRRGIENTMFKRDGKRNQKGPIPKNWLGLHGREEGWGTAVRAAISFLIENYKRHQEKTSRRRKEV